MNVIPVLFICLLTVQICEAQECGLTDLSKKYNYLITTVKSKDKTNNLRISKIYIEVFGKADKKSVQKLSVKSGVADSFSNCSAVRSYITQKNQNDEIDDNDWGDFIVADFNFDGREDFAVKKHYFNTGAFYEYFTQEKSGQFVKDVFLTEKVGYFGDIDAKNKTITTYTAATTFGYLETTFKYNPATKKWRSLKTVHRKTG